MGFGEKHVEIDVLLGALKTDVKEILENVSCAMAFSGENLAISHAK